MKIKNTITLVLAMTLFTSIAFSQTKRTRATPIKKTSVATAKAPAKGTLDLEAGLIFNSGDVKPVGRATFYLLKENPEKLILTQANLDAYNNEMEALNKKLGLSMSSFSRKETLDSWKLYSAASLLDGDLLPIFASTVKTQLEASSAFTATTGFDGKTSFNDVPSGDYYVFGIYKFGKQRTYWSVPVSVKAGNNKIVLDNDNMQG